MTDFWRRWHITLGAWFREYVYIPLGGNRQGKAKTYRNLLAVWLLTGLWHGAGWNYLLWGLSLFCIIAAEKAGLGKVLERRRVLGHLYMLLLIPLTWLIFAMPDLSSFGLYLGRLFGFGGEQIFAGDFAKYWGIYGKFLIPALILSTPLPAHLFDLVKERWYIWPPLLALFAACVYCTYRGMNDPFFYFRF